MSENAWASKAVHRLLVAMPAPLKMQLKSAIRSFGITVDRPSMAASFDRLKKLGFEPRRLVDVGAYHGTWTQTALSFWREAHSLMIEARASERASLDALAATLHGRAHACTALLGPENRLEADFFELEAGGGTGSSVLAELTDVARRRVKLPMRRLDDIVDDHPMFRGQVDLLKLDVQGWELEVLRGSPRVLERCEVVIMEIALLPYNEGAPLLQAVLHFMQEQKFVVFDIAELMRDNRDRVFQMDVVLTRESSGLRARS